MNNIVSKEHRSAADKLRELLSTYINSEDLINIGAYKRGTSKEIDEAIRFYPKIISFLKQDIDESFSINESTEMLFELTKSG